ncbi:MAG TPA: transcriptional regulator GcvA [Alphaproteobacteria bacterium]|nr:transcriptional regulator GcvA [Alphaproteobacteria bacterium]
MRRLPPLNALRAFEAAARHGSFVKAAAELGVTPGAVSQQIKALEQLLGLTLFRRQARGVRVTEAGRAYLPGIAEGFDRLARATLQVHDTAAGNVLAGRLSITVLPSFAAGWLVRRLPAFRARHPEIDLLIRSERQTVDLHREDADLAIRYGLGDFPNLEATHLLREEIFPVCAPALLNADPPLRAPEDLRAHDLLHDAGALGNEPWIRWQPWLDHWGLDLWGPDAFGGAAAPRPGLHFTDSVQLYQAALLGQGVALGRSVLIGDELASGRLVRPFAVTRQSSYAYYAVTTKAARGNPRVAAFIAWLLAEIRPDGDSRADVPSAA